MTILLNNNIRNLVTLACVTVVSLATSKAYGQVVYTINGGTPQGVSVVTDPVTSVQTATITLSALVTGVTTLHVYDAATKNSVNPPALSLPRLVINGSATPTGRLNVLIADGDDTFPVDAAFARDLDEGLVNFGGPVVHVARGSGSETYALPAHSFDEYPYGASS